MPIVLLLVADASVENEITEALSSSEGGFNAASVSDAAGFRNVLEVITPDLLILDPELPSDTEIPLLDLFMQLRPGVPVICVSQIEGEEAAVEALQSGAVDYLYRGRLGRLSAAAKRAVEEAKTNALLAISEQRAKTNDQRYRYFLEQTTEGFYRLDFDPPVDIDADEDTVIARMYESGYVGECNRIFAETYGLPDSALMIGTRLVDLHGGPDVEENIAAMRTFIREGYRHLGEETLEITTTGDPIYLFNNSVGITESGFYVTCWGTQRDITKQRLAEEMVKQSRGQLRALVSRLQRTQEDERSQVARDIHDELGQLLTGLKLDLRWIEERLSQPSVPEELLPLLDRAVSASELVDQTIAGVQAIAEKVRPGTLEHLGLSAALSARAREFAKRSEIPCSVHFAEPPPKVPDEIANELYYICQEALTNIARHAKASKVEIELRKEGSGIVLEVTDDGLGIDPEAEGKSRSLGITGMYERGIRCGGEVTVRRRASAGTRVRARVPIAQRETVEFEGGGI